MSDSANRHPSTEPCPPPSEEPLTDHGGHAPEPPAPPQVQRLTDEGLLEAVLEVEALLASQARHGLQRWRALDWQELIDHLRGHLEEVAEGVETNADTGHPSAAHLTARALMTLALALETRP